jgi:hypothetical protein
VRPDTDFETRISGDNGDKSTGSDPSVAVVAAVAVYLRPE